jgi:predicted RND superfamily exporter protein
VNSLTQAKYITSDSESIMVTRLVDEDFSGTGEEVAELSRRIASWDLYQGALVSDDLTSTQIMITLDASSDEAGNPEVAAVLMRLRDMAKEMFAPYANVYTAGQPVAAATFSESAILDMRSLIPLVILVVLVVLAVSFRRFTFVALPLLAVIAAAVCAVGAMPLLNIELTTVCIIIPIILVAVGSAYAVHVVSHYKDETQDRTLTTEEHRALVFALVRKLLKPVFLAALTTFAGFISFVFAPISPIRNFGIFSSFGVLVAFAAAITLIPALLIIRGPVIRAAKDGAKKARVKKTGVNFDTRLAAALCSVAQRKGLVLTVTALVFALSALGASRIVVDNAMVEFFNENAEVSRSNRFIREHFGGSARLLPPLETDDAQTPLSPETLTALDSLSACLTGRVPRVHGHGIRGHD